MLFQGQDHEVSQSSETNEMCHNLEVMGMNRHSIFKLAVSTGCPSAMCHVTLENLHGHRSWVKVKVRVPHEAKFQTVSKDERNVDIAERVGHRGHTYTRVNRSEASTEFKSHAVSC